MQGVGTERFFTWAVSLDGGNCPGVILLDTSHSRLTVSVEAGTYLAGSFGEDEWANLTASFLPGRGWQGGSLHLRPGAAPFCPGSASLPRCLRQGGCSFPHRACGRRS